MTDAIINKYDQPSAIGLSKRQVVELIYFLHKQFVSYEFHEAINEFYWELKVEMDNLFPNWGNDNLEEIMKMVRRGE